MSLSARDCNKVQEKRGAVYERITTINQEIQKIKFAVQQLRETTEREKLKSQVSVDKELTSGHLSSFQGWLGQACAAVSTFRGPAGLSRQQPALRVRGGSAFSDK